jgi:hypothetical protein
MELTNKLHDNAGGTINGNRVGSNDFFLEKLELSYSGSGFTAPPATSVNVAGRVAADGKSVLFAELIPSTVVDQIKAVLDTGREYDMVVTVKAVGRLYDESSSIKTEPQSFPVKVCVDCIAPLGAICPGSGTSPPTGPSVCPQWGQTATLKCET